MTAIINGVSRFDMTFYPTGTFDTYEMIVDSGRVLLARQLAEGLVFQLTTFAVGTGGIDWTAHPPKARPVDPALPALENGIFTGPLSAPVSYPSPGFYSIYFRVCPQDVQAVLGEYGIYATITASPTNPSEIGSLVLFAVGHLPPYYLFNQNILTRRVVISA